MEESPHQSQARLIPVQPGDVAQRQQPDLNDALNYLNQVRARFVDQPDVYNRFLNIIDDFKSRAIDSPTAFEHISALFAGNPDLILDFNVFLPPDYRFEFGTKLPEEPPEITEQDQDVIAAVLFTVVFGNRGIRNVILQEASKILGYTEEQYHIALLEATDKMVEGSELVLAGIARERNGSSQDKASSVIDAHKDDCTIPGCLCHVIDGIEALTVNNQEMEKDAMDVDKDFGEDTNKLPQLDATVLPPDLRRSAVLQDQKEIPHDALALDEHYVKNDPRTLGIQLPKDPFHVDWHWIRYRQDTNFDWNSEDDVNKVNEWRQKHIVRAMRNLSRR